MSFGPKATFLFRKSDKLVEQSRWSNCLSIIIEPFQK